MFGFVTCLLYTSGVVIKMVYNALLGQYKEINGYENGAPTYKANGTLAKAKFDVIDKKGCLLYTSRCV